MLCQISFTGPSRIPVEIKHLATSREVLLHQGRIDASIACSLRQVCDSPYPSVNHPKNHFKSLIKMALVRIGVPLFDVRERLGPHPKGLKHPVFMLGDQHPGRLFSGPWRSQTLRPVGNPVGR